jgi:hypothetical protein
MIYEMQRILIASISKQYILHGDLESSLGKAMAAGWIPGYQKRKP